MQQVLNWYNPVSENYRPLHLDCRVLPSNSTRFKPFSFWFDTSTWFMLFSAWFNLLKPFLAIFQLPLSSKIDPWVLGQTVPFNQPNVFNLTHGFWARTIHSTGPRVSSQTDPFNQPIVFNLVHRFRARLSIQLVHRFQVRLSIQPVHRFQVRLSIQPVHKSRVRLVL
jgi:hypothetical protein